MSDDRGKGFQTPAVENPPYDVKENFEVPEKDPDKLRSKLPRATGQTAPKSQKVRNFPSHT
jgi:hypothetical protein